MITTQSVTIFNEITKFLEIEISKPQYIKHVHPDFHFRYYAIEFFKEFEYYENIIKLKFMI